MSLRLPEAKTSVVDLTDEQAAALGSVGVELAGETRWWGSSNDSGDRSVFRLQRLYGGSWRVDVGNVVGVVGLPDLTIIIEPKIGVRHFAHLLERARDQPRVAQAHSTLGSASDLQRLVVEWFVLEVNELLRAGLVRDYVEKQDALAYVRGRIDGTATTRHMLHGRLVAECSFDDFTEDTPLNRLLAAAAQHAMTSPWVNRRLRTDLRYLLRELPEPGLEPLPDWRRDSLSPRDCHYLPATQYAMDILSGVGRQLTTGNRVAGTFLLNSALVVEDGIRSVLADALAPVRVVKTGGRRLLPALVSVHPDIEIGPAPFTGDVKYKIGDQGWNRSDLAQSILFATAYRSRRAIITDFVEGVSRRDSLNVGDIEVSRIRWRVGADTNPHDSENEFAGSIREMLGADLDALALD